jgi:photosystem II stability/assembly factor-like uncharacterized protein
MKRGVSVFIIVLMIILVVSLSGCNNLVGEAGRQKPLPAYQEKCSDTDGGINLEKKGITKGLMLMRDGTKKLTTKIDSCKGNQVMEYYCNRDLIKSVNKDCPDGGKCVGGSCVLINQVPQIPSLVNQVPPIIKKFKQTNGPLTDYNPRIFFDPDDPNIIYTSSNTGNGILKSNDGGESWEKLDLGITLPYIYYFDMASSNHNIMYATTATGQVFRSNDKGKIWNDATGNLDTKGMGIWTLAIHPENPDIIYIGTGSYMHPPDIESGMIFKTSNGGQTWEKMNIGNKGKFISSIVIDQVDPDLVYATTGVLDACKADSMDELAGVYKTTNGGGEWIEANSGLLHHGVHALIIDPTDHNTLFVGTGCVGLPDLEEGNIFKSTNQGESWTQIIDSPSHSIGPIIFDPNNQNIMYSAGYYSFFRSEDHGETWAIGEDAIYPQGDDKDHYEGAAYHFPYQIIVHPDNSNIIYMGTYAGGILKSVNGGENWIPRNGDKNKGFVIAHANAVSVFPSNPNIMYAATIGGPFKTTNGGDTWQPLKEEQHPYSVNRAIKVDPVDSNIAYFACLDGFIRVDGDDFKLVYGYKEGVANDVPEGVEPQFTNLLFNRNNHNIVYTAFIGETDLAPQSDGFYKFDFSNPNNPSWEKRNNGLTNKRIHALTIDKKTNTIYAGTESWATLMRSGGQGKSRSAVSGGGPGSLFKTTNEGQSWNKVSNDLSFITIYKLQPSKINPNGIYAATNGHGVFWSWDLGDGWEVLDPEANLQYITLIAITQDDGSDVLYAYDKSDQTIYKTTEVWVEEWQEFHKRWKPVYKLNNENDLVKTLAVDSIGNVYFGTEKSGFYKSTDNGETWSNLEIVPGKAISWIEIDPFNPSKIYAALIGEKALIYVSNDNGQTWSKLNDYETFSTIHETTVDPNNEAIVYAAPWGGGLFMSNNNGGAWQKIETPTISIPSVIVDPQNSNHIIIGDRTKPKIYESYDKGQTWSELVSLDEEKYYRITSMVLHQGNLYFSVFNQVDGFISILVNGPVSGTTFKLENNNPIEIGGDAKRSVLNFFSNGNDLYAVTHIDGVLKLENNKLEKISDTLPDMAFNNIIKDEENILYVSGGGDIDLNGEFRIGDDNIINNIYSSSDEGETWNPLLEGNPFGSTIKRLLQHPVNKNVFFAATANGLFVSTDKGINWVEQNNGLYFENIGSMFITDGYVYVGTLGGGSYTGKIESDYTIDWIDSSGPYPEIFNIQIKTDPQNQDIIYLTSFPGGVFKSSDAGDTWIESNFALPSFSVPDPTKLGYYNLEINPLNSNELYLGIFGKGVYQSTNGAQTWMPMYELDEKSVYGLTSTGDYLFVGTNGQPSLYKTPSDDQNWETLSGLEDQRTVVSSIALNPIDSNEIYVTAFPGGLFKTKDGGNSWHEISGLLDFKKKFISGIGFENFFFNVLVNPKNPQEVYLSGYLGELYRSEDGGNSWKDFSWGLVRKGIITDLDIDNNGNFLMVSQKAGGVSKVQLK